MVCLGNEPRLFCHFWNCTQFQTLSLIMRATPFLLRDSCPQFSSVQSLSHVRLFVTPWTVAHQASLSITNCQSLPKLMTIELVTISSSVPFSSHPESVPASGSFPMSQFFASGGKVFLPTVQFSSVTQSCLTLCDPMDCSTPGLPVHHQLPEFTQTHVLWVSDAI